MKAIHHSQLGPEKRTERVVFIFPPAMLKALDKASAKYAKSKGVKLSRNDYVLSVLAKELGASNG